MRVTDWPAHVFGGAGSSAAGSVGQGQVIGATDYCAPAWSVLAITGNEAGDTLLTWSGRPGGLEFAYRSHGAAQWKTQNGVVPEHRHSRRGRLDVGK